MLFKQLKINEKFNDPEFGPTKTDRDGRCSIYPNGVPPARAIDPSEIIWYRPAQITPKPQWMDTEGINAGDVAQGAIGDCWFISALSCVAANNQDYILSNMDPMTLEKLDSGQPLTREMWSTLKTSLYSPLFHYYATKGMYVIRFMKNYKWNYVIMDDKLPCRDDKVPVFARDKELKEFWVCMIEKAYAKLHGTYYQLTSGFIHEGLTDLTGSVPLRIDLEEYKEKKDPSTIKIDEFWSKLTYWGSNSMMGCSAKGAAEGQILQYGIPTGILSGHAYAILDTFKIDKSYGKGKSRLLRIRNPWGDTEWKGKWADDSEQIDTNKEEIKAFYKKARKEVCFSKYHIKMTNMEKWQEDPIDDGNFFMCYKDWRELFDSMYVCRNFFQDNEYRAVRFGYSWTEENSGGTPKKAPSPECERWGKNPQVKISVREASVNIVISVGQEDPRIKEKGLFPYTGTFHNFCFSVLSCEGMLQTSVPV